MGITSDGYLVFFFATFLATFFTGFFACSFALRRLPDQVITT